jgi:hypothetical protein
VDQIGIGVDDSKGGKVGQGGRGGCHMRPRYQGKRAFYPCD